MSMRLLVVAVALATGLACAPSSVRHRQHLPAFTDAPARRVAVDVPMRDGVALHTVVHRPKGAGPFPVVLTRTPYAMGLFLDARCELLVRYGYACVWQHVRRRVRSDGGWTPFEHEHDDGLDTLAWLREQPWQDGHVALLGESYMAAVQWLIAADLPPEVRTIIPSIYGTDAYDDLYEHGLWRHEIGTAWLALTEGSPSGAGRRYRAALAHRPRIELDTITTGHEVAWFRAWAAHPLPDDPWWQRPEVDLLSRAPARTKVPVLLIGGWSDAFLGPMLDTWDALATKADSVLVVGPWNHLGAPAGDEPLRGLDVGDGLDGRLTQWTRVLGWLDHHLRGGPEKVRPGQVVTFVHGVDRWVTRPAWPPPTEARTLWLAEGWGPEHCAGALEDAPPRPGIASYVYDPASPTPAVGGAGSLAGAIPGMGGVPTGLRFQRGLCDRRDVLGFLSPPLTTAVHVAGPLRAHLQVSTDLADTAIGIRVVERRPDGRDVEIRDAITTLSLRDGERLQPVAPGQPVDVDLATWPIEHVFRPGSRLLVEVVSADWPKVEAHAGGTERWDLATEVRPAHQTVLLGASRVELPVVVGLPGAPPDTAPPAEAP